MYWDFVAILKFSQSGTNRRLWDRICRFPVAVSSYVSEITSALSRTYITTTRCSEFLPARTRMIWNNLECPIHLNVRMSHGLLADSVDTSLASLLYSCKTDAVFNEVHDQ